MDNAKVVLLMNQLREEKVLVLDGGTGTEVERLGGKVDKLGWSCWG